MNKLPPQYKPHINIVFIGHVDVGKSTISSRILKDSGVIDDLTVPKDDAETKQMDSWAWHCFDHLLSPPQQSPPHLSFETETKSITILDSPCRFGYVQSSPIQQHADIGCLVISARMGEFEFGFNTTAGNSGQTLDHITLLRAMDISKIIVVVNKMDDDVVKWSRDRYCSIIAQLTPHFERLGYNLDTDVFFLPVSGLTGAGIKNKVGNDDCHWYYGPTLFQLLDQHHYPLSPSSSSSSSSLTPSPNHVRFSVSAITRRNNDNNDDTGTVSVLGKLHSGILNIDDALICLPSMHNMGIVTSILVDSIYQTDCAQPGQTLTIKFNTNNNDGGLNHEDNDDNDGNNNGKDNNNGIHRGCILSPLAQPGHCSQLVECQITFIGVSTTYPILARGMTLFMHIHNAIVECQLQLIVKELSHRKGSDGQVEGESGDDVDDTTDNGDVVPNKQSQQQSQQQQPKFLRQGAVAIVRLKLNLPIALEKVDEYPSLSRFTLRDSINSRGTVIAIGHVLRLKPQ